MKLIYGSSREQGVVSILSVIFFIILMSVLTVSFMRMVTDEQAQVIDDDLSKGALASAQSGVEDAKRALLYCRKNTALPACANLTNQTCPGIFADSTLRTQLGLEVLADNSIRVGDPTSTANQRYTCVTVKLATKSNDGTAHQTGEMQLIPLRGVASFSKIRFSWRQTDPITAQIPSAGDIGLNATPRKPQWNDPSGKAYLAVPRLQIVNFDHTKSLTEMRDNSVGMYLFPFRDAGQAFDSGQQANLTLASINPSALANKHVAINCTGPEAGYLCSATIKFPAPTSDQEYYLAIKSVYAEATYQVELLDDANSVVDFDNVQPVIDSTGAAANVYKRVLSKVNYEIKSYTPANVIESGLGVCKDFSVTRTGPSGSTCLGF